MYKRLFEDVTLNSAVQKIIKVWHLKRRPNEPRTFYEGSGVGNYNDDRHFRQISRDFKVVEETSTAYAWNGYSAKDLYQIDYTEGDIYLIVFDNLNDLKKSIKSSIDWAKKYR